MGKHEKEIKKVVSSMHMGNLLYKNYIKKTNDELLKKELMRVLNRFENHVDKMKEVCSRYQIDNVDKLNVRQELSLSVQLMKQYKNDYAILSDAIKGLNMGTLGMLDFIHNNQKINYEIKDYSKEILKDYDILKERLHKFGLETYC